MKRKIREMTNTIPSCSKDKGKAKEIIETSPSEQLLSESLPQKLPESLPKESPERSSSSFTSSKRESDSDSYDSTESNPDPNQRTTSTQPRESYSNMLGP